MPQNLEHLCVIQIEKNSFTFCITRTTPFICRTGSRGGNSIVTMDSQDDDNRKRRRIIIDDEEEEDEEEYNEIVDRRLHDGESDIGSNPDDQLTDDGDGEPDDGEDLMNDNWKE